MYFTFLHLHSQGNTAETTLNNQRFLLIIKFLIQNLPSAVCCLIAAYSLLLSSAEAKEAAESLVGIATCLLTGRQQNCASVPCSGKR